MGLFDCHRLQTKQWCLINLRRAENRTWGHWVRSASSTFVQCGLRLLKPVRIFPDCGTVRLLLALQPWLPNPYKRSLQHNSGWPSTELTVTYKRLIRRKSLISNFGLNFVDCFFILVSSLEIFLFHCAEVSLAALDFSTAVSSRFSWSIFRLGSWFESRPTFAKRSLLRPARK